jgi:hypothetical protein
MQFSDKLWICILILCKINIFLLECILYRFCEYDGWERERIWSSSSDRQTTTVLREGWKEGGEGGFRISSLMMRGVVVPTAFSSHHPPTTLFRVELPNGGILDWHLQLHQIPYTLSWTNWCVWTFPFYFGLIAQNRHAQHQLVSSSSSQMNIRVGRRSTGSRYCCCWCCCFIVPTCVITPDAPPSFPLSSQALVTHSAGRRD